MLFYLLVGGAAVLFVMKSKAAMNTKVSVPQSDPYYLEGVDGVISDNKMRHNMNSFRRPGQTNKGLWQQSVPQYLTGPPEERLDKLQKMYAAVTSTGAQKYVETANNPQHVITTPLPYNRTNEKIHPDIHAGILQRKRQNMGTSAPTNYSDPTQIGAKADPPHDPSYKS